MTGRTLLAIALLVVINTSVSLSIDADKNTDWWDTANTSRQTVTWSNHHDEIPAGATCILSMDVAGREIVAGNAFFDEGVTADSRCMASHDGKTHLVYLGEIGRSEKNPEMPVYIATKDHATSKWGEPVRLGPSGTSFDTHYFPVITVDDHGYLHVFYGCHNTQLKYRRSLKPNDSNEWTDEVSLGGMVSYPHAFALPGGLLYVFARGREYLDNRSISFIYSTDDGLSWSTWQIVALNDLPDGARAYLPGLVVDQSEDATRLHLAFYFTTKPVGVEVGWAEKCYYTYSDFDSKYEEGFHYWRKSRGDVCGVTNDSPMTSESAEIVASSTGGLECERAITELYLGGDGRPHVIVAQNQFGGDRWHTYLADAFNPGREWRLNWFSKSLNMPVWHARQGTFCIVDNKGVTHLYCVACPKHYKIFPPTSDGRYSGWTASNGSSRQHELVDDDILDINHDQTFLITAEDGARISFGTSISLPQNATILAVDVSYIARIRSGEQAKVKPFLSLQSKDHFGDPQSLDSDYFSSTWPVTGHGEYHHTWKQNPQLNAIWNVDDLQDIEFGLKFEGSDDDAEVAATRLQLRVLVMESGDPDWFAGELMEFYSTDNGTNWDYRFLSQGSSYGLPMLNLTETSDNSGAEIAYVRGNQIFDYRPNVEDRFRSDANDIRLVYDGAEIDRVAVNGPDGKANHIAFSLPDAISMNSKYPPRSLIAYTGNQNTGQPKQDPSEVFTILAESFESYESGEDIDGLDGWSVSYGSATVYQASRWYAAPIPNHNNRVYAGLQSLFCKGIGDSTEVEMSIGDDVSSIDIELALWLNTSGGCRCYLELADGDNNVFRVGLYGAGRCGVYHDTAWYETDITGAPSNQYVVRARVTDRGVTAWFRGEKICVDNSAISSVWKIRLKTEATEAYFDHITVSKIVPNPGSIGLEKAEVKK